MNLAIIRWLFGWVTSYTPDASRVLLVKESRVLEVAPESRVLDVREVRRAEVGRESRILKVLAEDRTGIA